jgi:hypothetical protein
MCGEPSTLKQAVDLAIEDILQHAGKSQTPGWRKASWAAIRSSQTLLARMTGKIMPFESYFHNIHLQHEPGWKPTTNDKLATLQSTDCQLDRRLDLYPGADLKLKTGCRAGGRDRGSQDRGAASATSGCPPFSEALTNPSRGLAEFP